MDSGLVQAWHHIIRGTVPDAPDEIGFLSWSEISFEAKTLGEATTLGPSES